MNSRVFNMLVFVAGAAVGSAVTWKVVKTKYERIAQEEIDSVKEVFFNREREEEPEVIKEEVTKVKPDLSEYVKMVQGLKYNNDEREEVTAMTKDDIYVISPEEFGENGYDTISLTYYADKILADEYDCPIIDVDDCVGADSLNRFGEYEDDSVFVRNDIKEIDYEILLDLRRYSDINAEPPYQVEMDDN